MMRKLFTFALLLSLSGWSFAQQGTIRGSVIEDATGEPMFAVTVVIQGTTQGATTDFDGKFEIKADPGTYNLQVSFVSYKKVIIEDVEVKAGEVTLLENIRMYEDVETLEEVVVSAEVIKTTEEALLTVKKKSANLIDGISAANFRKIGDSNAAAAVKRVPGVSIEGGKYVYVRGLGDRYTKSILNGMDIPGLDPDRNTLQMDIFPTNVIDNIIVLKTFTPELPADFTGGVVDITTKDFPEEKIAKVSIGGTYNPSMHFNSDYLSYEGGQTDFLGFDDGTREIPTDRQENIPTRGQAINDMNTGARYNRLLRNFDPTLAAMRENSFMDYSLGLAFGNQRAAGKFTLGYNVSLTYKNTTEYFEGAEYTRYAKDNDESVIPMEAREIQRGDFGVNNVLIGGLAGFSAKTDRSQLSLNVLHLQNGESKAGIFTYLGRDQGSNFDAFQHNLEYSERSITNLLLKGDHYFDNSNWVLEWKVSPTRSVINDPDIRFTRYRTDNDGFTMGTESGLPERIWRFLDETNLASRVDLTRKYQALGNSAKLRFGVGYTIKQRDYEIQNFQVFPGNGLDLTGNPNELFRPNNLWANNYTEGVYVNPLFIPNNPNKFNSENSNLAFYISNEMSLSEKLRTIVGVRAEQFNQLYTGLNQNNEQFNDLEVIDGLDFFPSVNFIYALKESQNVRLSYSSTIARPSFKEASFATILDPITGRTFIGGLFPDVNPATGETVWDGNLRETNINNFDLRWEMFQPGGQTFAVSAFFKTFKNPIEIVQYVQATNNFQPRNVGDGQVLGLELELRKNLNFISDKLSEFSFNTNITVTDSRIDMSATEYQSRLDNARTDAEGNVIESVDDTRVMAGQAPYIINAGLQYAGFENGLEVGLFYNVQGETLLFVGIADRPDIFSVPFHSLNLNLNKSFGPDDRMSANFSVSNILNDDREEIFKSFGAENEFFTRLQPGVAIGFGFGYNF